MYECSAEGRLQFLRKITLPSPLVDYEFDDEGNLMCLLASGYPQPSLVLVSTKTGEATDASPAAATFVCSFFSGIGNTFKPQPLDNYYKRWFDNVLTYQENKEKRMAPREGTSEGSDPGDIKRLCTEKSV